MSIKQRGEYFVRSHQVFSAANKILGVEFMANLWKKSRRQMYRWGADDDFCEEISKNPLDLFHTMLRRLQELGRDDIVEGSARLLYGTLGYEIQQREGYSDADSGLTELLSLTRKLGELASTYEEVRADGMITKDEQIAVDFRVDRIVDQALRFKDAVRNETRAIMRNGHGGVD